MKRIFVLAMMMALLLPLTAGADEEPVKPLLVVMDIQNHYIEMMDQSEVEGALRMINAAIWQFRSHELPIIRVYHHDTKWGPAPDSEEFQFPESVIIKDDDPKVIKNFPSGFKRTELDELIKEQGANTLFLCGLSATGCVLATYFGAVDLDYDVFMIKNALMSDNAANTDAVEGIVSTVDYQSLSVIVRAATD
ncbi:MAG: cysteine hydrolase [bacterium]|nr:cysteine hydrolase [bacterium]